MKSPNFNFSLFTPYEGRMLTTEASDLGLAPGNFPQTITVELPLYLGGPDITYTFVRYNGHVSAAYHANHPKYPTLEVFND